ncbi:Amino acid/auxin permease, partial [Globisporangium splendens]
MGKWFTLEDAKIAFSLFCCVYGIGTLGMPANFSRAGPAIATIALVFMAFANTYSGVVCSKVMLAAPRSVKTFGDLGEWCMGKAGRYLVVLSQMGVCLLVPCAFLVLGGILLNGLFPSSFESSTWIILMALTVLPVCLTPTLKEGAGAAFAGCMGTLIADVIGVAVLLHGMSGHPSVPTPDISFKQVATTFGNLSLAYGAGIVIPALQRQHSDPTRMPRIVGVTLTFISVLFLALAGSGYSAVGCQISGNLLFTIYPDATTGLTNLGFSSDKGMVVLAYLFMQLHITIAFAVIVSPAFYITERLVLGMHQKKDGDMEALNYESADTPALDFKPRASKNSIVSIADIEKESLDEEIEAAEYTGSNAWKYVILRTFIVAIQVVASVLLKDHFLDLTDFIGASCITMSCIVLPIVFYLKKLWTKIPMYEKVPAIVVVLVCLVLGCYVTYTSGKNLFNPDESDPEILFPFFYPEDEREIYYNATTLLVTVLYLKLNYMHLKSSVSKYC